MYKYTSHVYIHIHIYTHIYTYTYTYTYMYIYIYIYTYMYTSHVYINRRRVSNLDDVAAVPGAEI